MNVLDVIEAVCASVGIAAPSSAVASSQPQAKQLVELFNQEGRALSTRYSWERLIHETTFTTQAAESQGTVASIVGASRELRYVVNETLWNRTTGEPIYGPRSARTWQGYKAVAFAGPYPEYRIRGGELLLLPAPTAGQTIAFEYVSRSWLTDSTGSTYYTAADADTDVVLLPEELMVLGVEWRWRRAKGLEYAAVFQDYEYAVLNEMSRDGTKPVIDLGRSEDDQIPQAIPRVIGT